MKCLTLVASVSCLLLFTNTAHAQAADQCAGVTCSNHGYCVIGAHGGPACACEDGYMPDPTTGLSCQPIAVFMATAQPGAANATATEQPPASSPLSRKMRAMAKSGFVLTSLGLMASIGALASYWAHFSKTPYFGFDSDAFVAWFVLMPTWYVMVGVGAPLVIVSHRKGRVALGNGSYSRIGAAALAMYGVTMVCAPLSFVPALGLVTLHIAVASMVATFGLVFHELVKAGRAADKMDESMIGHGIGFSPFIAPTQGGAIAGLGGYF